MGRPAVRAEAHFGSHYVESEEYFLRFSSEPQKPSCKAFQGLSALFRHFRFNLLLSRLWLTTAVRTVLVATIVADRSGDSPNVSSDILDHFVHVFFLKEKYFFGE